MIPMAYITQWRQTAPWIDDIQVEQDLILSRALVEIFSNEFLSHQLAFRGGTALHKLFFSPAARYSEDLDFVRTSKGSIKEIIDAIRDFLEPWLGPPKTRQTGQSFKLLFYFSPEGSTAIKQKIKIEINIRETFAVLEHMSVPFSVESAWFTKAAAINTFHFEELLATKLRALYERKKGRDAFDLWLAIREKKFDIGKTVDIFLEYMNHGNRMITRKLFADNLDLKLQDPTFLDDIEPLLSPRLSSGKFHANNHTATVPIEKWSVFDAIKIIKSTFIDKLAC